MASTQIQQLKEGLAAAALRLQLVSQVLENDSKTMSQLRQVRKSRNDPLLSLRYLLPTLNLFLHFSEQDAIRAEKECLYAKKREQDALALVQALRLELAQLNRGMVQTNGQPPSAAPTGPVRKASVSRISDFDEGMFRPQSQRLSCLPVFCLIHTPCSSASTHSAETEHTRGSSAAELPVAANYDSDNIRVVEGERYHSSINV